VVDLLDPAGPQAVEVGQGGDPVDGDLPVETVYDIAAGRGYRDAERILGGDFAGLPERDGWAPCRRFADAEQQTWLAHLLRRCSELLGDAVAGQAKILHELRRILQDALAPRDDGLGRWPGR
jgi:hypothetical protein